MGITRRSALIFAILVLLLFPSCSVPPSRQPNSSTQTAPTELPAASPTVTPPITPASSPPVEVDFNIPAGRYILYSEQDGTYAISTEAGEPRKLSDTEAAQVSPDGSRIRFGSLIYDIGTGESQDVSFLFSLGCSLSSGSPDGQYFALRCEDGELYIYSLASGARIRISDRMTVDDDFETPLWSPDGKWIAYIRTIPGSLRYAYFGKRQLFLVDTRCLAEPSRCLHNQVGPINGDFFDGTTYSYSWSPDSTSIAIPQQDGFGFLVYDLASGHTHALETGSLRVVSLAWMPDGASIAFTGESAEGSDGRQVFLIPAEGGAVRQLTFSEGEKIVLFAIER